MTEVQTIPKEFAPSSSDPVSGDEEKGGTSPIPPRVPRDDISTWQWILILVGLYLGALLYGLDTTIAADVQSSIYKTFRDIPNLPWIGIGFPMASVAVILLVGRSYDQFNIKVLMLASIAIFEGGSALLLKIGHMREREYVKVLDFCKSKKWGVIQQLCGGAPSSAALVVGRVIAGIGGAGMYLGNALIGLSWGTGAILGPVIGGAFSVSSATWRWAFYINLPLAGLLSPVYFFIFPSWSSRPDETVMSKLRQLDWLGATLNGATFALLMIALTFSGSTYAWSSGAAIALWVVSGIVIITYILQQVYCLFTTSSTRIFPVHFLQSRTLVLVYISTAAASAANATALYYIPLFFSFTRGDSALTAAVRLLPFITIFIFVVMLAGGSLPVVGRYAPYYTIGGVLTLVGSALMFTIRHDTPTGNIYGYEVLIAAGTGLVFQNGYAIAAAKVEEKDKGNAIGFINVAQIGTIAISLSIAGSLFENLGISFLRNALQGYGLDDSFIKGAMAGADSAALITAGEGIAKITVETVAYTVSRVFGMGIAAGALLLCSSLLMKWEKIELA